LQERTYERVGSSRTRNVDIRLVAATNQNLEAMVNENRFRSDLYYRLNVFPIRVPPLRERREDIPLLVRHFMKKCARQMGKRIDTVAEPTMQRLMSWHWPGNIRELQNVVERCVIMAEDAVLRLEPDALPQETQPAARGRNSAQRAEIEAMLRETNGRIAGPQGAAARMGVPVTTLSSRIRALNINKHQFHLT